MSATENDRPNPDQHQAADALPLDGVKFSHEFQVERHAFLIEERNPILFVGLLVLHPHGIVTFLRPVMRHVAVKADRCALPSLSHQKPVTSVSTQYSTCCASAASRRCHDALTRRDSPSNQPEPLSGIERRYKHILVQDVGPRIVGPAGRRGKVEVHQRRDGRSVRLADGTVTHDHVNASGMGGLNRSGFAGGSNS